MSREYCNPVPFSDGKRHTNPDPYILSWCGKYYCYASDEFGVKVSVSEDLVRWHFEGYALREEEYRDYWAPAVFYDNGTFYMYYSNVPSGCGDCHQEWLKLAVSENPVCGFRYRKTFFNKFSIDAHPVLWNGKLEMFYSVNDWNGTDERRSGTSILIDEMKDPQEFSGNPREAVIPGIRQEIYAQNRFGDGRDWYTIEGASHVVRGGRFWLLYSANAYVNTDYFIGTAVAECKNDMKDMNWKKYPSESVWHPLLKKNDNVEGTGHNTVAKAPNMADDWIVYHGRFASEELVEGTEQREMRIDPLYFNGEELLCFGPSQERKKAPGLPAVKFSEERICERKFLCDSSPYYMAEMWIRAELMHTGACWGFFLNYQDENNYVELRFHSGKKTVSLYTVRSGLRYCRTSVKIKRDFDYTVPHRLTVIKRFNKYEAVFDGMESVCCTDDGMVSVGKAGIVPYFTDLTLISFAMTRSIFLTGNDLRLMGELYGFSAAGLDGAIGSGSGQMELKRLQKQAEFKEAMTFDIQNDKNCVEFIRGGRRVLLAENVRHTFSVYHIFEAGRDVFLANGRWIQTEGEMAAGEYSFKTEGVQISEYENTEL